MNKNYGARKQAYKLISCILTVVLLLCVFIPVHNVGEANELAGANESILQNKTYDNGLNDDAGVVQETDAAAPEEPGDQGEPDQNTVTPDTSPRQTATPTAATSAASGESGSVQAGSSSAEGTISDHMPATQHPSNPTPITRFAQGSLGAALTSQSGSLKQNSTSALEPGEVRTSKTATPVAGKVNTWDITVRVEGRDNNVVETTDIVLVIDRSGSMADNKRMANTKSAAKNFIDAMIAKDPNLRIAVVSYSSDFVERDFFGWPTGRTSKLVTTDHGFSNNPITLKNAVDGLVALGGTHTQAGIIQGKALLDGSDANNKFMVLLSDGQPTYSYRPNQWTTTNPGDWPGLDISSRRTNYFGVYNGSFDQNNIVGTGGALTESFDEGNNIRRHIHNGEAAIKAGVDARANLTGLFTIAAEAGEVGTQILKDIASPGMAYSTQKPVELQGIYDKISAQISTQSAIRNAVITDEMGDGFSLIDGSISTTEGTTAVAAKTATNNQKITWTIVPAVEKLVAGSTDVRYAEMTYRVEINPDILTATPATTGTTPEHDLFATNKSTQMAYIDINDGSATADFTSPEVDPVLLKIKKVLKDGLGTEVTTDSRTFNVQITNGPPKTFDHTEGLVVGAEYVWLTTLRDEGIYNVQETSITGAGITDLKLFDVSYSIDGGNQTSFSVNHDSNGIPRGDVVIVVTNQTNVVDVTIQKEVTGNFRDLGKEFPFTVVVTKDEYQNTFNFNLADGGSETIKNLPAGAQLKLTEVADGYEVTVMVGDEKINPTDGSYIVNLADGNITIKVTNNKDLIIDTGILLESLPYMLILAIVAVGLGLVVIRRRSLRS